MFEQLVVFLLVSSPFAFYFYQFAPINNTWDTYFFTIQTSHKEVDTFLWALGNKSLLFMTFLLWFLSCKHWWKYAILVPFGMSVYQLIGVLSPESSFFQRISTYNIYLLLAPIFTLLIWVSHKLGYTYFAIDKEKELQSRIEDQIASLRTNKILYSKNLEKFAMIKGRNTDISTKDYIHKLLSFKQELTNITDTDTSTRGINEKGCNFFYKIHNRKTFILEFMICLFLIMIPYLFYTYRLVPKALTWEASIFKIYTGDYVNVHTFIWLVYCKMLFVFSYIIWFMTNKHWWKYALLIPLTMFFLQLITVLSPRAGSIDEIEFWYSLPIALPIIILIIWLSKRLNYHILTLDLQGEVEMEVEAQLSILKPDKTIQDKYLEQLRSLQINKKSFKANEYLYELLELRSSLKSQVEKK